MNSEIVGRPTDMPWGFVFIQNGDAMPRHPAQLYEAVAYFAIFFVGLWLYRRHSRKVGSGYFFGYCLTAIFTFRFFIEFLKEVQEPWEQHLVEAIGLNQGQLLSLPFILIGLYCWLGGKWCRRLGEQTTTKN